MEHSLTCGNVRQFKPRMASGEAKCVTETGFALHSRFSAEA